MINITNIDKIVPEIETTYSKETLTNENVTVTIVSNKTKLDYQFLEYLRSASGTYINTGVLPNYYIDSILDVSFKRVPIFGLSSGLTSFIPFFKLLNSEERERYLF